MAEYEARPVTAPREAASPRAPGPCPGRRGQGFAQSTGAPGPRRCWAARTPGAAACRPVGQRRRGRNNLVCSSDCDRGAGVWERGTLSPHNWAGADAAGGAGRAVPSRGPRHLLVGGTAPEARLGSARVRGGPAGCSAWIRGMRERRETLSPHSKGRARLFLPLPQSAPGSPRGDWYGPAAGTWAGKTKHVRCRPRTCRGSGLSSRRGCTLAAKMRRFRFWSLVSELVRLGLGISTTQTASGFPSLY